MGIRKITERLNPVIVKNILFLHAWTVWDTTSAIFNKAGAALMRLISKVDREGLDICSTFDKTVGTPEKIGKPGV